MIRIIIVEDDPLVAQLNAAYLSRLDGFQVTGVFTNSLEALTSLRENPVELAIVDVYMPVCTGVELLRRVRSEQLPTAVIMLIMQIGHLMSVGYEKTYLLQNTQNLAYSEIISTYVYKVGLTGTSDFSYSTAIGLFNSFVNCAMLVIFNTLSNKLSRGSMGLF